MFLANPNEWLPWVDQVDRPYFIAIEKHNKIYSEFLSLEYTSDSSIDNWYDHVDKRNLKYFVIRGRFGWYYLETKTGLIYTVCQHQMGENEIQLNVFGLQLMQQTITSNDFNYQLKHFKISDIELMGIQTEVLLGMNCEPTGKYKLNIKSQTSEVVFGWSLQHELGFITFEGCVRNRVPGFALSLLFTPHNNFTGEFARIIRYNALTKTESHLPLHASLKEGVKYTWKKMVL